MSNMEGACLRLSVKAMHNYVAIRVLMAFFVCLRGCNGTAVMGALAGEGALRGPFFFVEQAITGTRSACIVGNGGGVMQRLVTGSRYEPYER